MYAWRLGEWNPKFYQELQNCLLPQNDPGITIHHNVELLTLGAHAQRGLQQLSRVSVCLLPLLTLGVHAQ